jgi:hypothetical protein
VLTIEVLTSTDPSVGVKTFDVALVCQMAAALTDLIVNQVREVVFSRELIAAS